jgi:hypothetical protein
VKNVDIYKEIITVKRPNMTVRIHIPDITAEEKEKRLEHIKKASTDILREVYL